MKKLLKFAGLILVVAVLSFGVSLWWSQRGTAPEQDTALVGNSLIDRFIAPVSDYFSDQKGSIKLTNEEASFAFLIPSREEVRYYVPRSGEIKSINLIKPKEKAKVVTTIKPRAIGITWSLDGTQLIATYGTDHITTNLTTGISKTLDRKITEPKFATTTDQVAYLYFDSEAKTGAISIADAQFKDFKNILKTRLKNWELQWSNERRLSLLATSAETKLTSLFLLDIAKGELTSVLDSRINLSTNWSPDGNRLLYSRQTRSGLELYYIDMASNRTVQMKLYSMASKCAWGSDNTTLYCAIPEKAAKPDDFNGSDDRFVKIDTAHPEKSPETLFTTADASFVDAREVLYAPIQQALIFKNFKDGRLYLLSLAK